MADTIKFYYPDLATAGAATPTLTLNGPVGGQAVEPTARFVTGTSVNGTRYVYQKNTVTQNVWVLQLNDVTAAQKALLDTFWNDTVKGPSSTWDYRHTDGTDYAGVRFADANLEYQRIDTNFFSVQLRLELPEYVVT